MISIDRQRRGEREIEKVREGGRERESEGGKERERERRRARVANDRRGPSSRAREVLSLLISWAVPGKMIYPSVVQEVGS